MEYRVKYGFAIIMLLQGKIQEEWAGIELFKPYARKKKKQPLS